jgi:CHAT domain-containing protein/tetratricopeptide (TPR) repeat protein
MPLRGESRITRKYDPAHSVPDGFGQQGDRPHCAQPSGIIPNIIRIGRLRAALIGCLAILTILVALFTLNGRHKAAERMRIIGTLLTGGRPIESRLADMPYASVKAERGGRSATSQSASVDHAELALLTDVDERPEAQSNHALGAFELLQGRFDYAIGHLERALASDPGNAVFLNDLGAALLERGKKNLEEERQRSEFTGKPLGDIARSIELLHRALDTDSRSTPAIFNIGLAQEQLGLTFAARDSFSSYLSLDASSGWANEASQKVSKEDKAAQSSSSDPEEVLREFLEASGRNDASRAWGIVCANRSPLNGKYISETLLDLYIDQSLAQKWREAQSALSALAYLGNLESRNADEHYTQEEVEFYKNRAHDLVRLKQARMLVRQGHELYLFEKVDEAAESYRNAASIFELSGDTCEALAANYRVAFCQSENRDVKNTLPVFERLDLSSKDLKFKLLEVRSLLGIGSDEFSMQKYSKAFRSAFDALAISQQVGDQLSIFTCLDSIREFYRGVQNQGKVLGLIENGLEYARCPSINRLQNFGHYSRIASELLSAGYPDCSLEYRKEAARFLPDDGPRSTSLYYADLGATYSQMHRYNDAQTNLDHSYELAQTVSPEQVKTFVMAYSSLQRASFYAARGNFQNALTGYTDALSLSQAVNYPAWAYQARKGLLRCHMGLGEDSMVAGEIGEALDMLENDRGGILEQGNRNTFFDAEQNVYDLAIDYECTRKGDADLAFEYSERSRCRSLLDMVRRQGHVERNMGQTDVNLPESSPSLSLADITERLPRHVRVLQYSVLAGKTVVWILPSDKSISFTSINITEDGLSEKVKAYLETISHYSTDDGNIASKSRELFSILLAPVIDRVGQDETICVVADKILNNLPFETLISAKTGRYLIEDFPIFYSPSSSLLVSCSERAAELGQADDQSFLGVGNPAFSSSAFKELKDLPYALAEVNSIAGYYRNPLILTGHAATKEAVWAEMPRASVVHLAAHSVLDEDFPLRSKIVLADKLHQTGDEGTLECQEIYGQRLPKTRLVVLSSCQSGIDRYYKGEGMMSFAHSFMAAGVPTVVATLWPLLDSESSANLMIEFHRNMVLEHLGIADSLRTAKLKLIKDGRFRNPYFWAPFIVVGGCEGK